MSPLPPLADERPEVWPPPPASGASPASIAGPGATATPAPPAARRWWRLAGLGAVALAGCAYVGWFDPNTGSALYPPCPFKLLTGLDCPGCGMTRALHSLVTGHPLQALDHNAVFVLALPFVLWWLVRSTLVSMRLPAPRPLVRWRPWMTWAVIGTIGAFWVLRNLPWAPFHWLGSGLA